MTFVTQVTSESRDCLRKFYQYLNLCFLFLFNETSFCINSSSSLSSSSPSSFSPSPAPSPSPPPSPPPLLSHPEPNSASVQVRPKHPSLRRGDASASAHAATREGGLGWGPWGAIVAIGASAKAVKKRFGFPTVTAPVFQGPLLFVKCQQTAAPLSRV